MPSRYTKFNSARLSILPLQDRESDLGWQRILPLEVRQSVDPPFPTVASRIIEARQGDPPSAVVLMMGAHVLRSCVQQYVIDLLKHNWLSCIAMNGAGVIHDFELALTGATTESVSRYIKDGRFGLWRETGRINDIVKDAAEQGLGLGEAVGAVIEEEDFPHKDISVLAAGYRFGVPITVHVGIGYDIVHQHPNCDGAAYGQASYTDFLIFVQVLESLEGGVVMDFGSAVMAPEVYLKALSMVRNVARQQGRNVSRFTTLVCDLFPIPAEYRQEACREDPGYFFRPWKTMLIRTVADGGESFYCQSHHRDSLPQLWSAIVGQKQCPLST